MSAAPQHPAMPHGFAEAKTLVHRYEIYRTIEDPSSRSLLYTKQELATFGLLDANPQLANGLADYVHGVESAYEHSLVIRDIDGVGTTGTPAQLEARELEATGAKLREALEIMMSNIGGAAGVWMTRDLDLETQIAAGGLLKGLVEGLVAGGEGHAAGHESHDYLPGGPGAKLPREPERHPHAGRHDRLPLEFPGGDAPPGPLGFLSYREEAGDEGDGPPDDALNLTDDRGHADHSTAGPAGDPLPITNLGVPQHDPPAMCFDPAHDPSGALGLDAAHDQSAAMCFDPAHDVSGALGLDAAHDVSGTLGLDAAHDPSTTMSFDLGHDPSGAVPLDAGTDPSSAVCFDPAHDAAGAASSDPYHDVAPADGYDTADSCQPIDDGSSGASFDAAGADGGGGAGP